MSTNESLYRVTLSGVGAALIGSFGLLAGLAWASALDASTWVAGGLGAVAAIWGAVVVHLTPTGGTITENRTTVNYAVFALHAWYALFLCLIALAVLAVRTWAL